MWVCHNCGIICHAPPPPHETSSRFLPCAQTRLGLNFKADMIHSVASPAFYGPLDLNSASSDLIGIKSMSWMVSQVARATHDTP